MMGTIANNSKLREPRPVLFSIYTLEIHKFTGPKHRTVAHDLVRLPPLALEFDLCLEVAGSSVGVKTHRSVLTGRVHDLRFQSYREVSIQQCGLAEDHGG